jgi:hypothetical protein
VAAQCRRQKNFVTIVTRRGLKTGGKLIPWRRRQTRVRGRQCLFARSRSAAVAARPSQRGDRMTAWFAGAHESVVVKGFGCRPLGCGARLRPASERLQGKKPREWVRGRCFGALRTSARLSTSAKCPVTDLAEVLSTTSPLYEHRRRRERGVRACFRLRDYRVWRAMIDYRMEPERFDRPWTSSSTSYRVTIWEEHRAGGRPHDQTQRVHHISQRPLPSGRSPQIPAAARMLWINPSTCV